MKSIRSALALALRTLAVAAILTLLATTSAFAVPSYAEQTGQPCASCHIGGFGPQLTPFGRAFKLSGYTMRTNDMSIPVSAMAVFSYVHTAADQAEAPAPHYGTNDNGGLDEASVFLAGGIGDHVGGFAQFTYDGVGPRVLVGQSRSPRHATDDGSPDRTCSSASASTTIRPSRTCGTRCRAGAFPTPAPTSRPGPMPASLSNGGLETAVLGRQRLCLVEFGDLHRGRPLLDAVARFPERHGLGHRRKRHHQERGALCARCLPEGLRRTEFRGRRVRFLPRHLSGRRPAAPAPPTSSATSVSTPRTSTWATARASITLNARYTHERQSLDATLLMGGASRRGHHAQRIPARRLVLLAQPDRRHGRLLRHLGLVGRLLYADNRTLKAQQRWLHLPGRLARRSAPTRP